MTTILQSAWTTRLSEYNDATTYERAFWEGEYKDVDEADDEERKRLIAAYGSLDLAMANPVGRAAFDATMKTIEAIEDRAGVVGDVTLNALFALMVTPAPDWGAVQTKIAAALELDYDELTHKPERALESIRRDIMALTAK
jgi:hypothetical protein